ncbi:hypothetical protein NP493_514g00024 [Ridgeia piscesae]|uniref:Uncharacterized protein n=1 Tax=Ridgeia piscesae TaxID=27915 RepID=A0AAD9KXE2_RIDPI|nr:hypothetical protein NP493_514g00024 [Ridgeia piscesae]
MGLTQGPFLIAQGAYIASLATRFSVFGNYDFDVTLCLFSGTYFAWTFSGLFVHTALEAALLKPATEGNCSETAASVGLVQFPLNCLNVTAYSQQSRAANVSVIDSMLCADGEMYYRRLALLGCYTLCSLAGLLLVALAVVPLNATGGATVAERPSLGRVSCSVVRKIGRSRLIMVIPLMVCTGLSQMLVVTVSDYVTTDCRQETQFGDNLLLTQAVTCAGASFAAGFVAKYVARVQTIVGAVIVAEGAVVVLLVFPSLSVTLRFVTVLAWGVAVAVLQTQLLSLVGSVSQRHDQEAGYAVFWLCQALSYVIAATLVTSEPPFCISSLLLGTLVLLVVATAGYVAMEISLKLKEAERKCSDSSDAYIMPDDVTWLPRFHP